MSEHEATEEVTTGIRDLIKYFLALVAGGSGAAGVLGMQWPQDVEPRLDRCEIRVERQAVELEYQKERLQRLEQDQKERMDRLERHFRNRRQQYPMNEKQVKTSLR